MSNRYKKKIKQQIENHCISNYNKIPKSKMSMGNGLFNQRCQANSVQLVKEGRMKSVYSCICISSDTYPIVHFINLSNDKKFMDNTLGYRYEDYDYYIIRKIDESEFHDIDNILMTTKKSLLEQHSNKFLNKVFRIDESNLGI